MSIKDYLDNKYEQIENTPCDKCGYQNSFGYFNMSDLEFDEEELFLCGDCYEEYVEKYEDAEVYIIDKPSNIDEYKK